MEFIFLSILVIISGVIFYLCRKRNAGDILAFNTILGILSLFMIGVLANDNNIWIRIISFLGLVSVGSAFASIFYKG